MPTDSRDLEPLLVLAKLDLEATDRAALAARIERLLAHFRTLEDLDTDGVPPTTTPFATAVALAPDTPGPVLSQESVLELAPESRAGCIQVPRVIDG